jgi:hypothetical protein
MHNVIHFKYYYFMKLVFYNITHAPDTKLQPVSELSLFPKLYDSDSSNRNIIKRLHLISHL